MKDIKNCLEKQLEISKELNDVLSKVNLIEEEERQILYKENERLLNELNKVNNENINLTNDRIYSLRERVKSLIENESTHKDPNFYKYLISFDKELEILSNKVNYLDNNLTTMNQKHCEYVDKVVDKSTKQKVNTNNVNLNLNKQKVETKKQEQKLEFKLGSNILNIIGVVLILIALITFGKYVYTNYMNDMLKGVSLFAISSLVLFLGEHVFKKKVPKFATGISALGVGGLYASLIINYLVLETINSIFAIILTLIITGISLFISKKNNSDIIRVIALVGGYGCLVPMDYLDGIQSYITVIMLLIISIANVYIPLKNNRFSIYSSILNVLFCVGIVNSYFLEDIAVVIYLSATLLLNNFMYIKLSNDDDHKNHLSALLTSLYLISLSVFEYQTLVGIIYLAISLGSILMANNKLKNIYYIHSTIILICLIIINDATLGIFYTVIYCLLMGLNVALSMKDKDKYLEVFSVILIAYGLLQFIAVEGILNALIYMVTFSMMIYSLGDKHRDYKFVIALKHTYFGAIIYLVIAHGVVSFGIDINKVIFITSILSIIYVFKINNIERLKHSTVKNSNKLILIGAFVVCNLFGFMNLFDCILSLIIGSGILVLMTNDKYVESKFIAKHKLLMYSIYLTYGSFMLLELIPLSYSITDILTSVVLMIVAFSNVWIGFKLNKLELRKYGLILSLIVCAKLILVDFYLFDFVVKTVLFLIVGVVALAISYIYSKLEHELKDKEEIDEYLI